MNHHCWNNPDLYHGESHDSLDIQRRVSFPCISNMASASRESIWSSMIAARQLSTTFYTLSTCLTDFLHRYLHTSSSPANNLSSSLFHNLDETLFSSTTTNQSKLLNDYSNVLQNILQKNSLHTNIIQNVRRLFRFDSCLQQLFTTELNEHCQCQECDCTISNSITDVIHDIGEIRTNLLTESSQTSCACFRCGDQNQLKTLTFKQCSSCLALTVNCLNINATDQLINAQGVIYELSYIIEFDSTSRSIINVYLREDTEFVKVDGNDLSSRSSTITSQGKFLTLWFSQSTTNSTPQPAESNSQATTFLSPPQSASSSSQLVSNSVTTAGTSVPYQTASAITFDDILLPSDTILNDNNNHDDETDDQFWNSLTEDSTPVVSENISSTTTATTTNNDTVSELFLTLLHSSNKGSSPAKTRTEHDRTVNTFASDVLWPLIVDKTNRRTSKKSSSSTTTTQSISSQSSTRGSMVRGSQSYKQLPSTLKSRRPHPYTTA